MYGLFIAFEILGFIFLVVGLLSHFKIGKPLSNQYFVLTKKEKETLNLDVVYKYTRNQYFLLALILMGGSVILYFLKFNFAFLAIFIIPFIWCTYKWDLEVEKEIDLQKKSINN